jgi:hypothetical protein
MVNLALMSGSAVTVLSFMFTLLSRLKKVWLESAEQTRLLKELNEKFHQHLTVTHKELDRRVKSLERPNLRRMP